MLKSFPAMLPACTIDGFDPHQGAHAHTSKSPQPQPLSLSGEILGAWHGTISVLDREFRLGLTLRKAHLPPQPAPVLQVQTLLLENTLRQELQLVSSENVLQIDAEPELAALLEGREALLKRFWEQSHQVDAFLCEVVELLTKQLRAAASSNVNHVASASAHAASSSGPSLSLLSSLAREIQSLPGGWTRVVWMNERTGRELRLQARDDAGREHRMEVKLPEVRKWKIARARSDIVDTHFRSDC